MNGRLKLSDGERSTLGEIGHRLGRTALAEVATVAKPDTILAWYRKLVAHKFDGSKARRGPGRPRVTRKVEQLIVRLAAGTGVMIGLPGRWPIWDIVYAITVGNVLPGWTVVQPCSAEIPDCRWGGDDQP